MVALLSLISGIVLSTAWQEAVYAVPAAGKTFTAKDLAYGPAYGVNHDHLLPKNFDDTSAMLTGVGAGEHRELWKITCSYLNQYFIGLQEYYKIPGSNAPNAKTFTNYHGWTPVLSFRAKENSYELGPGEDWDIISYRYCGRKLTGIHFGTTKKGGGVACGNYDYNTKAPNCGGDTLRAPAGRRMIGIYGDANGVALTTAQGVRGIGMITIAK